MKFLLPLLLAACAPALAQTPAFDADAPNAPAPATDALPLAPKSAATLDAWVWRFQPPVGSRWQLRTFTRISIKQDTSAFSEQILNIKKMENTIINRLTVDCDVLSRDKFGASTIRVTYRDFSEDFNFTVNDNDKGPAYEEAEQRAVVTRAFRGASFTLKQASDGKIWSMAGADAMVRRIEQASAKDVGTVLDIDSVVRTFGPNQIKKILGDILENLPKSPVRVGESWDYQAELPKISRSMAGARTLKSLAPTLAVVSTKAKLNPKSDQSSVPNSSQIPRDTDYSQVSGTRSGTARVDRASGIPLETTANEILGGPVIVKYITQPGQTESPKMLIHWQTSTRTVLAPR